MDSYLRQIGSNLALTRAEETRLAVAVKDHGCKISRERLIRSNLRFVVSLARQYGGRGLDLPELIQEGNLGLMKAVERFDSSRGTRLTTYASWWIRLAIERALSEVRPVHIPIYMLQLIGLLRRTEQRLRQTLGRSPSPSELALELGLPLERVEAIRQSALASRRVLQPGGDYEEPRQDHEALAPDTREERPEEQCLRAYRAADVQRMLSTIDGRDAGIVRQRFGLDGEQPLTCQQIALSLKISGERVRQIISTTLGKMRVRAKNC